MARAAPKRPARKKKPARVAFAVKTGPRWLAVSVGLLALLALVSQFARFIWLGAVLDQLGFWLLLCALAAAAVAGLERAWPTLAASLLVALVWALPLFPVLRETRPTPQHGPTLRVMTAHLGGSPLSPANLVTDLVSRKTDVAVLTAPTLAALSNLSRDVPGYRSLRDLSPRAPWVAFVKKSLLGERPKDDARVRIAGCDVHLQPFNLPSLFAYTARTERASLLKALEARPQHARTLWLGHLGSSPRAPDVSALLTKHELRDARAGHGRLATYPASLYALGLPVDHMLLRGWLRATDLSAEAPLVNGAHRTLRATLEVTDSRCQTPKP